MRFRLLAPELVETIHDRVLNAGEVRGRARDRSLEGALGRVENRLAFGLIGDPFDLAAAYALALSTGHCFNDGNKRTAYRCLLVTLDLHGLRIIHGTEEIGDRIILLAQGRLGEDQLAAYLRSWLVAG
jgi:death-on-curing protein